MSSGDPGTASSGLPGDSQGHFKARKLAQTVTQRRRPRPEDFPDLFDAISENRSLRSVCVRMGLDPGSTSRAIRENPVLCQQYAHAREVRADVQAENALTVAAACLAGTIPPERARVFVDACKWAAGQMHPRGWNQGQHPPEDADDRPAINVIFNGADANL